MTPAAIPATKPSISFAPAVGRAAPACDGDVEGKLVEESWLGTLVIGVVTIPDRVGVVVGIPVMTVSRNEGNVSVDASLTIEDGELDKPVVVGSETEESLMLMIGGLVTVGPNVSDTPGVK